ncbi:DUF4142 domain-containing protein [Chitinophaga sp. XS-30]|uniref:DUF4142 domain-containing protein n=1 Tax=Chitinophaga sp. XS-30 TaxID=2604421 RepID=UPI0011DD778E|nr:DUF4142 domain-containing protein [Chitinophaga sp. XS-30]QEH41517.1 DUF4142 domain-containing protein [Chitinophaga sp. XS-30]
MKTSAILLSFAIAGMMAACNNNAGNNNQDSIPAGDTGMTRSDAQDINRDALSNDLKDDAKNITKAAEDGLYEVKITSSGKTKATSAGVKKLAEHMQKSHEKLNQQLAELATKKNVTIPTALNESKERDIANIMEKTGNDFDKAFVDELVDKHEKAIDLFEKTAEHAQDPEVRDWFSKTLPELRSHLEMAKAEKEKLK